MSEFKKKNLFIEINESQIIIAAGIYDEELNFSIINKKIIFLTKKDDQGILDYNVNELKKGINEVEKNINYQFENANVIIDQNHECINLTGFKKLNGNQILSEDISYILNDLSSKVVETEKQKRIIHLFNTKYLLDSKIIKNLPIGLHGNFYSHQLTFFLIKNNEYKNISSLLNQCNLNLNKIFLKSFTEGVDLINKEKKDTFFKINIHRDKINLFFFYDSAFSFSQNFNFGSNIIYKDISKLCSLEISNVINIIKKIDLDKPDIENQILEKKYFGINKQRKISLSYIKEIALARIEEIIKIIFEKNKMINVFKDENYPIYLFFEDENIGTQFKKNILEYISNPNVELKYLKDDDPFIPIKIYGEILSKGWIKEAIPIVHKKKSWITKLFSSFFE